MPYDTFNWKGIDGTEILTHFINAPGGYNGNPCAKSVLGVWNNYRNKSTNRDLLICYGYGDGGGGANRDMIERIRCLEKMPGAPKVKTERVDEYFARLHETFDKNENNSFIPTWDGELYLEFHRNVYLAGI